MPKETEPRPLASLIQRTFIPHDLSASVSILTVPREECGNSNLGLRELAAQFFGSAQSDILDNSQYASALHVIADSERWLPPYSEDLERHLGFRERWFPHSPYAEIVSQARRRLRQDEASLGDDLITLQLAPPTGRMFLPTFPFPLTEEARSRFRWAAEVPPETLILAFNVLSSAVFASDRVRNVVDQLHDYYIPFGRSPATSSDTLGAMINSARGIAVAPLVAAAIRASTFISTGQYAAAIECAAAGAAATIIIIGSVGLCDIIVYHLSRLRAGRRE